MSKAAASQNRNNISSEKRRKLHLNVQNLLQIHSRKESELREIAQRHGNSVDFCNANDTERPEKLSLIKNKFTLM